MPYGEITSFLMPSIFGLVYASAFTSSHVCTSSLWGIQCEDTLSEPQQICPTQMIPGIDGDTMHVNTIVDFGWRGVDQRIFVPSAAAPLEKPKIKKTTLHRDPFGVWVV